MYPRRAMNQNTPAEMNSRGIWILLILLALLYIYGSNVLPLLGPDEPRYAQVARQMFESGDWITPRLGEYPWFEKPVLLYWMMSLCFAIFGVTEFAARLPSAVSALACVFLTYNAVKKATNEVLALLSATILGTSAFLMAFSHAASFDMLVTTCIAASLWYFFQFDAINGSKTKLFAAYAFCGLGILAKGFVAPAVIALAAGIYWLLEHRFREINKLHLLSGILLACAVAGIWMVPVTLIHGSQFWDDFFLQHHLMRYTSAQFHRAEGVFFFVPILLLGMYPWTGGIFCGFRGNRSNEERKLIRFSAIWLISSFVFFSLSRSKLPGYIVPLAPPFAVLSAIALCDAWKHGSRMRIIVSVGIFHIIVAAGILLGFRSFQVPHHPLLVIAAIILAITLLSAWLFHKQKLKLAVIAQALIPTVLIVIAVHAIYPATDLNETRTLCRAVNPELGSAHKIAVYNIYDFPLVFYTNAHVELNPKGYFVNLKTASDLYRYLLSKDRGYIIARNEELLWMQRSEFLHILKVISGSKRSIVVLRRRK